MRRCWPPTAPASLDAIRVAMRGGSPPQPPTPEPLVSPNQAQRWPGAAGRCMAGSCEAALCAAAAGGAAPGAHNTKVWKCVGA